MMRTQLAIVGAGPAGLLLSQLLAKDGIHSIVLERRSRDYCESRVRAGLLEPGPVALLHKAGVSERMDREGLVHDGVNIAFGSEQLRIDVKALAGHPLTIYGQTEIVQDLIAARLKAGGTIVFEAEDVAPREFDTAHPQVSYRKEGRTQQIACDFIAGCDGFHGICRTSAPSAAITTYERVLPFGWLGILSETPPVHDELIYSRTPHGFSLSSMRSMTRSRYYVQVSLTDAIDEWPDARFWDELKRRLPDAAAARLVTGPSFEKSIAPLRSFVAEPMRFGRLFLAGDAVHIVPPTGAKGLNLAAHDAGALAAAFADHYARRDDSGLDSYSERCLRRVWQAERFSWWYTAMTHRLDADPFGARLQEAEFDQLCRSRAAQEVFAKNYAGLFAD
jgi:p-hydroxybenzoate 3-monooxygenase